MKFLCKRRMAPAPHTTADRAAAEKLNGQGVEYSIVSKEADQSQQLYQDLLKRLKEAGVVEGLHSSSILCR